MFLHGAFLCPIAPKMWHKIPLKPYAQKQVYFITIRYCNPYSHYILACFTFIAARQ